MALFTKQIRIINKFNNVYSFYRHISNTTIHSSNKKYLIQYLLIGCGTIAGIVSLKSSFKPFKLNDIIPELHAKEQSNKNNEGNMSPDEVEKIPSSREIRFLQFASMEVDGLVYMTPADFLDSITEESPRARTERNSLCEAEVSGLLMGVPDIKLGTSSLFRDFGQKGIISFTEYLFLICVLTKPKSGFKIAFNMFDMDGNERVDRKEFLVMERILSNVELIDISMSSFSSDAKQLTAAVDDRPEQGRSNIWNLLKFRDSYTNDNNDYYAPTTTLSKYFFGRDGKKVLCFENFSTFMVNLQQEVLELEFNEYSKGKNTITEIDFGKILLKYTILSMDDQKKNLDRLAERIPDLKGIDFNEFKKFGEFLNNLEDFTIAMKMFSFAGKPITQDEFKRAVVAVTGQSLDSVLVNVVFQLFDNDGDGQLSHREFISVMKDRLHRGFKVKSKTTNWKSFKTCVGNELKMY